ncbi:MAG: FKBP-type peptidyl-prolyl cis-trans isomerase [Gammaproteobacteria bacterium]|nr:FKBP-type peptidyl-prolyl cis-trans isomerase [Gammaproteobacteria bacterium]
MAVFFRPATLLLGVLSIGAAVAQVAPTPSTDTPKAAKAPPAADKAATPKAGAPAERNASYSLGVSMGSQLRANGVKAASVNAASLAQGVRDALAGKAEMSETDQKNIMGLINAAGQAIGEANHRAAADFLAENAKKPGVTTTASGLQYEVLSPGSGDSPKSTDNVTVNYRGTLMDGTEFDSSYKRGQPATFQLNHVIPGWTEGVGLMKPGAKYKLYIPPQLAYDLRSPPGSKIPPGSLLIFEVELIGVKPAAAAAPAAQPNPTPQ